MCVDTCVCVCVLCRFLCHALALSRARSSAYGRLIETKQQQKRATDGALIRQVREGKGEEREERMRGKKRHDACTE